MTWVTQRTTSAHHGTELGLTQLSASRKLRRIISVISFWGKEQKAQGKSATDSTSIGRGTKVGFAVTGCLPLPWRRLVVGFFGLCSWIVARSTCSLVAVCRQAAVRSVRPSVDLATCSPSRYPQTRMWQYFNFSRKVGLYRLTTSLFAASEKYKYRKARPFLLQQAQEQSGVALLAMTAFKVKPTQSSNRH